MLGHVCDFEYECRLSDPYHLVRVSRARHYERSEGKNTPRISSKNPKKHLKKARKHLKRLKSCRLKFLKIKTQLFTVLFTVPGLLLPSRPSSPVLRLYIRSCARHRAGSSGRCAKYREISTRSYRERDTVSQQILDQPFAIKAVKKLIYSRLSTWKRPAVTLVRLLITMFVYYLHLTL